MIFLIYGESKSLKHNNSSHLPIAHQSSLISYWWRHDVNRSGAKPSKSRFFVWRSRCYRL